ncbi:MAG: cysteine--tRNA ligase, partial [Candidatus Paceibacterota bacterium]
GGRMGKSLGNAFTLLDIEKKGYDVLDLRYFYLTAHYRKVLNFTWEALDGARTARHNLISIISQIHSDGETKRSVLSTEKLDKVSDLQQKFIEALENDLNMPQALSFVWETVKSNIPSEDKYDLVKLFDNVLGLNLAESASMPVSISEEIQQLIDKRNTLRGEQKWNEADLVRVEIEKNGWMVEDTPEGTSATKK